MNDTIRKAITELIYSKDQKITFDLDEETIDLKVDKVVKLINDVKVDICYEITIYIGMVEYNITLSPAEYNVDYIFKTLNFIINESKNRREQIQESIWKSGKVTYCIDDEEEDKQ